MLHTQSALFLLVLVGAFMGTARADEVLEFSTPSKNIGCVYATFSAAPNSPALPPQLRCDIGTGLRPKPAKPPKCMLNWGDSFEMFKHGRVEVTCHGDTALGGKRILAYGKTWRHNGFTCVSRRAGLTCTNLSHHGFFLSRARSRSF